MNHLDNLEEVQLAHEFEAADRVCPLLVKSEISLCEGRELDGRKHAAPRKARPQVDGSSTRCERLSFCCKPSPLRSSLCYCVFQTNQIGGSR